VGSLHCCPQSSWLRKRTDQEAHARCIRGASLHMRLLLPVNPHAGPAAAMLVCRISSGTAAVRWETEKPLPWGGQRRRARRNPYAPWASALLSKSCVWGCWRGCGGREREACRRSVDGEVEECADDLMRGGGGGMSSKTRTHGTREIENNYAASFPQR